MSNDEQQARLVGFSNMQPRWETVPPSPVSSEINEQARLASDASDSAQRVGAPTSVKEGPQPSAPVSSPVSRENDGAAPMSEGRLATIETLADKELARKDDASAISGLCREWAGDAKELLSEVRRLRSAVSERDQTIEALKAENEKLKQNVRELFTALQMDDEDDL